MRERLFDPVEDAIDAMRQGRMCIVCDDEDRENEGDLVFAADAATPELINFMAREGRGLICVALPEERVARLQLPMMARHNTAPLQTAFTVSVEARHGTTTGISAHDRARTVQTLVDDATTSDDLVMPGHMFPLVARDGGVLVRAGQTEASVDLARLAGRKPAGVICEIMSDDGTMARVPELRRFADRFSMPLCSIADLIEYRRRNEVLVAEESCQETTWAGRPVRILRFRDRVHDCVHVALVSGAIDPGALVDVRVQGEPAPGYWPLARMATEFLGIEAALDRVALQGGVFLFMRHDGSHGPFRPELPPIVVTGGESERTPPPAMDRQTFGIGAQILYALGVRRLRLLTNHPRKIVGLHGYGLDLEDQAGFALETHGQGEAFLARFAELFA